ncbi:hypothetical protein EVAR_64564_1 [Eumeta japonica]|uniref:Uncharacterized protein n=1 Tax=Eumeta variegata TaxID=151549 RepID=A0A4C1ZEK2_EUMVA|nr:hypothetical protein EVAR_64564_1 [Eumeta japonica]
MPCGFITIQRCRGRPPRAGALLQIALQSSLPLAPPLKTIPLVAVICDLSMGFFFTFLSPAALGRASRTVFEFLHVFSQRSTGPVFAPAVVVSFHER